jgi:uroporphyrinogen-III synthase
MRLLLTRPQPDAGRTAAALRLRGHAVIVAPLLRIEAVRNAEFGSGPWAAILVTSANAARAIASHPRVAELRGLPAIAVGERTAEAMRAAGFANVAPAAGAASDLVRIVPERLSKGGSLLYLAGADRAADIADALQAQNFRVHMVIVYRAVAAETLPPAAVKTLERGLDAVLHFSRRTADTYIRAARAAGLLGAALGPAHYCLSARVAEPLARAGAANIRIADEPTEDALLKLVPAA